MKLNWLETILFSQTVRGVLQECAADHPGRAGGREVCCGAGPDRPAGPVGGWGQTTGGWKREAAVLTSPDSRAAGQGRGLASPQAGSAAERQEPAAVSPVARTAWRRRARAARAAAPASARTLSPQIRRRAPSTRPPSRARPRTELTLAAAPSPQHPRRAAAASHRDEVVPRAAPARSPPGSGGLSAGA